MYQLDPFTRLIAGMLSTELHDLRIECLDREYKLFSPPAGQTCQQWAAPYIGVVGGYLANGDATADCQYCPYRTGDGSSFSLSYLLTTND